MDLVEDWQRDTDSDHPVAPDPLVLNVVFHRELRDLRGDGVRVLHGAAWSVRHGGWFTVPKTTIKMIIQQLCNKRTPRDIDFPTHKLGTVQYAPSDFTS